MSQRPVHILSGDAQNMRYAERVFDSATANKATEKLANDIRYCNSITFKDDIRLVTLVQLTQWFDTEFGILVNPKVKDKSLILKKGEEGGSGTGGKVSSRNAPEGSFFLLHTHPTEKSFRSHFDIDVQNSANRWEAVVDLSCTVIVFKGNEFANIKNQADASYMSLEYHNPQWPSFLTKNPRTNVCVSPRLYWENAERSP